MPTSTLTPRRLLGYWDYRAEQYSPGTAELMRADEPTWPDPQIFVDTTWDPQIRDKVIAYLVQGKAWRNYRGLSPCRFCAKDNGAAELTDGIWVWPEGLAHYLAAHQVRLPDDFVIWALAVADQVTLQSGPKNPEPETTWWEQQIPTFAPLPTIQAVAENLRLLLQNQTDPVLPSRPNPL